MKNNFFRKDLNLKNKWWHRFLSVVFVSLFILFTGYMVIDSISTDYFRGGDVQQWKKTATLSERITPEIKPINKLIKLDEKIGEGDKYSLNIEPTEYYKIVLNDTYCSTKLSENYEKVIKERNINELYLSRRMKVSPKTFEEYINKNNINCLIIDAYTTYDEKGQANGKLHFIEPDKTYQDNWSFYQKSTLKTVIYFLEIIPIILISSFLFFSLILVIYYKIILYIIFGNKK